MGLTKTEEFAKKIIRMAAEKKLTVGEFYEATDIAKGIADYSAVEAESAEKADLPSQHISMAHEELFTPEDSSGTKYSPKSSSIPFQTASHKQSQ